MITGPTSPMTCTEFEDLLGEYLEGDLDAGTRAAAERHRASCAHCAGLVADLERIATEAAHLPTLRPSRDLWAGIAERIEAPIVGLTGSRPAGATPLAPRHRWFSWPMAAAAAVLMAVTAGVTHQMTAHALRDSVAIAAGAPDGRRGATPQPRVATTDVPPPAAPENPSGSATSLATTPGGQITERPRARPRANAALAARRTAPGAAGEAVYDQEITELRALLTRRRAELDPETVAILERNLGVIDAAIRQSREALEGDPRSPFLGHQLTRALDKKVQLLRTAVSLPSRT